MSPLSIDALAVLLRLASKGPESTLNHSGLGPVAGRFTLREVLAPLIDRRWVLGNTHKVRLTDRGLQAALQILSAVQTVDSDNLDP